MRDAQEVRTALHRWMGQSEPCIVVADSIDQREDSSWKDRAATESTVACVPVETLECVVVDSDDETQAAELTIASGSASSSSWSAPPPVDFQDGPLIASGRDCKALRACKTLPKRRRQS